MTKKRGAAAVVVIVVGLVLDVVVLEVVVDGSVVGSGDDAAAGRVTSTAPAIPSENATSAIATTAVALRRGGGFLTTYLRCRSSVVPGSRSLPGAGRVGLRSRCGPRAPPGSRSST